jgi:hypothetical protein
MATTVDTTVDTTVGGPLGTAVAGIARQRAPRTFSPPAPVRQ